MDIPICSVALYVFSLDGYVDEFRCLPRSQAELANYERRRGIRTVDGGLEDREEDLLHQ